MKVRFAGMTDTGLSREANEDNLFISETEALAIVADGMGGHASGEVASAMAVDMIGRFYDESLVDEEDFGFKLWPFKRRKPAHTEERRIVQSVLLANSAIFERASTDEGCRGMGTTIVGAYFLESGAYFVHIGDSRAYRFRKGRLELLTADHSLANEYLQMGILRPEEVEHFPYKNVITRAVGLAETVEPEIQWETLRDGDIYLFCSDGLTDPVSEEEIEFLLNAHNSDLNECCRAMIDAANAGGGPDNITVVLAHTFQD